MKKILTGKTKTTASSRRLLLVPYLTARKRGAVLAENDVCESNPHQGHCPSLKLRGRKSLVTCSAGVWLSRTHVAGKESGHFRWSSDILVTSFPDILSIQGCARMCWEFSVDGAREHRKRKRFSEGFVWIWRETMSRMVQENQREGCSNKKRLSRRCERPFLESQGLFAVEKKFLVVFSQRYLDVSFLSFRSAPFLLSSNRGTTAQPYAYLDSISRRGFEMNGEKPESKSE